MHVVIGHFHFDSGGVTAVVRNHLQALAATADDEPLRITLAHGGRGGGIDRDFLDSLSGLSIDTVADPAFEYDALRESPTAVEEVDAALTRILAGVSEADPAIIHWHNHSLGKNAALAAAIDRLRTRPGVRWLLQMHDFAEDFRPNNWRHLQTLLDQTPRGLTQSLYRPGESVRFAVINGRDEVALRKSGVPGGSLDRLPNPVVVDDEAVGTAVDVASIKQAHGLPTDRPLALYPVRGIRRKNIGEAILWTICQPEAWSLGVTLAPKNPAERTQYEAWGDLCRRLGLPVRLGMAGPGLPGFAENIAAADAIVSTSVAEGFGMVFLEAALFDRPLVGRDLPAITHDFRGNGLTFSGLYRQFVVPTEAFDVAEWSRRFVSRFREVASPAAGESVSVDVAMTLAENGGIDFRHLFPDEQRRVVEAAAENESLQRRIRELNSAAFSLDWNTLSEEQSANAGRIREHYSLTAIGRQLRSLYRDWSKVAIDGPAVSPLAEQFERLDAFCPIRVVP